MATAPFRPLARVCERKMTRTKMIIGVAILAAAGLGVWLWESHSSTDAADEESSAGRPAGTGETTAAVARAQRRTLGSTLTISGEFKPFQDVDIHAKVAGYIRKIYVDVGDHVKEGQTIAVLEVPELAAQLAGADAAVR